MLCGRPDHYFRMSIKSLLFNINYNIIQYQRKIVYEHVDANNEISRS